MDQRDPSVLLSSLIQSIRDACQSHLQHHDFVSVSGFICLDIDGCSQERVVLAEIIPRNKDENNQSFHLKTLNWTNIRRQSKIKSNTFRRSRNVHYNEDNSFNLRQTKELAHKTWRGQERNFKSTYPGFCSKRTDLRNLTFTLDKSKRCVNNTANSIALSKTSSTTILTTPPALKTTPQGKNKVEGIMLPTNKLKRSFSNNFERKRSFRSLKNLRNVLEHDQHTGNLSRYTEEKKEKEIQTCYTLPTKEVNSQCKTFKKQPLEPAHSANNIRSTKQPFLVDHDEEEQVIRTNATNSNIRPTDMNIGGFSSVGALEFHDGLRQNTIEEESNIFWDNNWYSHLNKINDQKDTHETKEEVLSRATSAMTDSPFQCRTMSTKKLHGYSPSLSSVQPLKKKKRLMRWMDIFKRGTKHSPSEKTCSATTSLSDFTASWTGSISSIQQQI